MLVTGFPAVRSTLSPREVSTDRLQVWLSGMLQGYCHCRFEGPQAKGSAGLPLTTP